MHNKIVVEGQIEVCSDCLNSLGYNVAWDQTAHVRTVFVAPSEEDMISWQEADERDRSGLL